MRLHAPGAGAELRLPPAARRRDDAPAPRGAQRFAGPWGGLEQRELEAFRCMGASHVHVAAFITLRTREGSGRWVRDGIPTLAKWACMSPVTMRAALNLLVARGLVEELKAQPRSGSWSRPRRTLSYPAWPADLLSTVESCENAKHRHRIPAVESPELDTRQETAEDSTDDASRLDSPPRPNPARTQRLPNAQRISPGARARKCACGEWDLEHQAAPPRSCTRIGCSCRVFLPQLKAGRA